MTHDPKSNRPIGGFFELEIPTGQELYHSNAIALSNGRACLMVALQQLQPKRAFVPHYTCDATLEPFRVLDIDIEFYELNDQFEPEIVPETNKDDCYLLTNYWGLQRASIDRFEKQFGDRLIVDNTHDFFFRPPASSCWSFTSARKWFGVPDGAFLYSAADRYADILADLPPRNCEIELQPALDRALGRLKQGYQSFQKYEQAMDCRVKQISTYSSSILSLLDHEDVIDRRRKNFSCLANQLNDCNQFSPALGTHDTPFCYPYLPIGTNDRHKLHRQQIFVPQLWQDVTDRAPTHSNARTWSETLLPLPIDHRYGVADMNRIAATILQLEAVT
jgi:hypothetical protein